MSLLFENCITEDVGNSFFVFPNGNLISVDRHINSIIDNPEAFGFSKDQIESIYNKHNEPLGIEGNAREEILIDTLERGIIRVRKYMTRQGEYWSINVYRLTDKVFDQIHTLAESIKDKKISRSGSLFDEVRILETKTGNNYNTTIKDIIEYKFFDEVKGIKKENFLIETTIAEYIENKKLRLVDLKKLEKKDYLVESVLFGELKQKIRNYCEINNLILSEDEIAEMELKDYDDFYFVDSSEYSQQIKKYGRPKVEKCLNIGGTKVKLGLFSDYFFNQWISWCITDNDGVNV